MKNLKPNIFTEVTSRLVLILFYGWCAYLFWQNFEHTGRLSSLLYLISQTTILLIGIFRSIPKTFSSSLPDWLIAIGGTLAPMLLRPTDKPEDDLIFFSLQIIGAVISYIGLLSLNKSFGIVPANRGVKISGIYKYIRHPLYLGYVITDGSIVLQNWNLYNFAILAVFFTLQYLRIVREEKFLLQDKKYRAYAANVKWRLVPGLW